MKPEQFKNFLPELEIIKIHVVVEPRRLPYYWSMDFDKNSCKHTSIDDIEPNEKE